ncbi:MAG: hypothetical protein DLM60_22405 [Pseudonocardiales bacterium]|nr:MAG: hypothetical protein DLM60_22405 [Pseudonocardiales bacterium]
MSRYVRCWRLEHGRAGVEVVIAQTHEPGAEGEVDFGEFYAEIAGTMTKCHLFVLRLSCSAKAAYVAFTNQGQEAFLEGHVRAFEALGGVPQRIRTENVPRNIFDLLWPTPLCGRGPTAPSATVVNGAAGSFSGT